MAKKKVEEYCKVIVMTDNGAVFVTEVNNWERTAKWEKDKKPLNLTKDDAQYLAMGLTMNGHLAFATCDRYDMDKQPYRYETGNFYWRKKKVKKNEQISS